MKTLQRDFIPISHTFPNQKPFMDENGKRKLSKPVDLRVSRIRVYCSLTACQTTIVKPSWLVLH